MPKFYRMILIVFIVMLATCCTLPSTEQPVTPTARQPTPSATSQPTLQVLTKVQIVRHPAPFDFSLYFKELHSIPKYDPKSTDPFQVDLRSQDLTEIDLNGSLPDLVYASFDSKTQWPAASQMPADFDWKTILETGKDPGLGIRALHEQGITGQGVGIAIIDQTLLVDHIEYEGRILVYEEMDDVGKDWSAAMHGPAVASIAVGKTVGVAPEASLYYIATGSCGGATSLQNLDFSCTAKAVRRLLEINKSLPADYKIRVLSMSFGWEPNSISYDQISAAVTEAEAAGIFVISSSLGLTHELYFQGLGREPLDNPNQFNSYVPGLWWERDYFSHPSSYYFGNPPSQMLLVPMDSRTTASPTGGEDYVFYRIGGWSWSIPYLAGVYTLAAQVKPEITPQEFWETALDTGRTIQIQHNGKDYEFRVILDPQSLIEALRRR